jgi:hypothetical protein
MDREQIMKNYLETITGLTRNNPNLFAVDVTGPRGQWPPTVTAPDIAFFDESVMSDALDAFWRRAGHHGDDLVEYGILPIGMRRSFFDTNKLPEGHIALHIGKGVWLVQNQWDEEDAMNFRRYLGRAFKEGSLRLRDKELA